MRELKFKVKSQNLLKDAACDFSGIVWKTENYLLAKFLFNDEWRNASKVAVFKCLGKEYPAKIENSSCVIPSAALRWRYFDVYVVGKKADGMKITTNLERVEQEVS